MAPPNNATKAKVVAARFGCASKARPPSKGVTVAPGAPIAAMSAPYLAAPRCSSGCKDASAFLKQCPPTVMAERRARSQTMTRRRCRATVTAGSDA